MADQQFCLRWNNHQSTLISVFDSLLENGTLVDCTLAAEGQYLKAHKVVLSACSPYLETLLSQHYEKHPIVILKDVKFTELKSMMDYMYRGEVNISQDQLGTFLKAAESLQIKGLSDNGSDGDGRDVGSTSKGPPPRKTQPAPPTRPAESQRPDLAPASPAHRSRDGSISPSSRKRRRTRRNSQDDDANMGDSHLDSNSCDLPSQAQSTPIVPNIPAAVTSITTTPIKTIVKPEQTELVNRIDTSNLNSLPPESGLLKEKIEPISEPLLEPKTEYLDDANNDDSVEDLTLDDDDEMDEMDMSNMSNMSNMSRPGPSHGNDVSNQGFVPWQMGNQAGTDEVFMAAQEAVQAHRGDSQGGNPNSDPREHHFAPAFCSVTYGHSDNYFSELNNSIFHADNVSHSFEEKHLCLGKETDDFNRVLHVDTDYNSELEIEDDSKNYQFLRKCGAMSKIKKRSLKYNRYSKEEGNCNTGCKQALKKEKREVKHKNKIFSSLGRQHTREVEVTSSGRERRPLVWSGDSFTTISPSNNAICEPHNELKKSTKKKVRIENKSSDPASVMRKKVNTNRSQYYKSGIHTPGSFNCESCGRKYRYLRGLRQHMRDSCVKGDSATECAPRSPSTPPQSERRTSTSPECFAGFSPKDIAKKRFPVLPDSPAVRVSQPRNSKSRASLVWQKGGRNIEETIKVESEEVNETVLTKQSKCVEETMSLGRGKRMKKPKTNDSDDELEGEEIDSNNKINTNSIVMKQKIKESNGTVEVKSEELEDGNLPSTSSKHNLNNGKTTKTKRRMKKKTANTNGFKCDQCGRKYKYLRGMRQHKKLECNKEPQFPCPYCPSRFRYRQNIREHVRNNHEQAFPKWYTTHYVVPMFL